MTPMPERIYTRPALDKLGVAPGARVALVNLDEPWFRELLAERTPNVRAGPPAKDSDVIFLGADSQRELAKLAGLRQKIRPNGAIWVVSRKGKARTIRDVDVIEAALAAGLVDNKVVSFSETQTALRLVIRLRDRPAPERGVTIRGWEPTSSSS
jgi:hypothetical protein